MTENMTTYVRAAQVLDEYDKDTVGEISLIWRIEAAITEAAETERAWNPTHRHIKTGGLYRMVTRANMEADLAQVIVYDSEDGTTWVRPEAEFNDGRFQAIEARALAAELEGE